MKLEHCSRRLSVQIRINTCEIFESWKPETIKPLGMTFLTHIAVTPQIKTVQQKHEANEWTKTRQ